MNEPTLMDLVDRIRNRFYGKYRGTVTKLGTSGDGGVGYLRAKVPAVLGDQETGWCSPCVPYAGSGAAFAFIPEKDAGVWIEFEGGDVSFPIWTGCYWHRDEIPSQVAPDVKVIKTPGGQQIVLDDKNHAITITDSNGNTVTLETAGVTIARKQGSTSKGQIQITETGVNVCDGGMEVSV